MPYARIADVSHHAGSQCFVGELHRQVAALQFAGDDDNALRVHPPDIPQSDNFRGRRRF
jgi:hypothetical protein